MPKDAIDDAGICDKGDDAHAAAAGATQRFRFEDFFNQTSPRASCFPGAIRIVALGKYRCRQAGAFSICRIEANPAAVGIGAIKSLTMSSRIRDMRRDAVNPCERVHLHGGCDGFRHHGQAYADCIAATQAYRAQAAGAADSQYFRS